MCAYHQKRVFMVFRKMCLVHGRLPHSYTTTDELRRVGEHPCGRGGNADVWRGTYQGYEVAIKVLRVNSRDLIGLEKVQPLVSVPYDKNPTCADESATEILFRSGPVEAV